MVFPWFPKPSWGSQNLAGAPKTWPGFPKPGRGFQNTLPFDLRERIRDGTDRTEHYASENVPESIRRSLRVPFSEIRLRRPRLGPRKAGCRAQSRRESRFSGER